MAAAETSVTPPEPPFKTAGRKKMFVLVVVAVLIVAGLGTVAYILISRPPTPPPGIVLQRIQVSPQTDQTMDEGELLTVTALGFDSEGTDRTTNTSFQWSAAPAVAVEIRPSGTPNRVQVFGAQAGSVRLTASGSLEGTTREGILNLTIRPVSFVVTSSTPTPLVGDSFILTVQAVRGPGITSTRYNGTVHFSSADDPAATLPGDYEFTLLKAGIATFEPVAIRRAGSVRIDVTDTIATVSGSVTVNGNQRPNARITTTANATDLLGVHVDGKASSDPDGDSITFSWNFGDGTPAATVNETDHRYAAPGTYTIGLTVQDPYGATGTSSTSFRARARPSAAFVIPSWSEVGNDLRAAVDASASADPDGSITTYNWTWGDGNFSERTVPQDSHVYNASFRDTQVTIELRVTDNDGLSATKPITVTVTVPFPPDVQFTVTLVDQLNRTVYVDASATTDRNGDLRYFNWTWADGTYTNGTEAIVTHTYDRDGPDPNNEFIVNLTVEDFSNLKNWTEQPARVLQPIVPPSAAFNATRRQMGVDVDANLSFDYNRDIVSYDWTWGDTTTSGPSLNPLAAHTYASPGAYQITLTVTDSGGRSSTATRWVSVNVTTIDYEYYDFFNVPYGEWWDYRFASYGDLPMNAECFNATSIADGVCTAGNAAIPDASSYPYANWYPLPGTLAWQNANSMIYSGYRMRIAGINVPGYNRSEPVFLPTLNYDEAPGNQLDFEWRMNYLDKATGDTLTDDPVDPCPGVDPAAYDGFYIRSQIVLTMDLQQSRRTFGVVAADANEARNWWASNTNSQCVFQGTAERNVQTWFRNMGGGAAATPGKYNIANGFEWFYVSYFLDMEVLVDLDGTTYVTIDHAAWGTEVLLARMFYWGNTSYLGNYLDSTKARGWWGMELGWFEDFDFAGSLGAPSAGFDFTLNSALHYHLQHLAAEGANGYDQTDDVPYWRWGPNLNDYTNDYFPNHRQSELDRYPTATYVHSTPGSKFYGDPREYDYAPIRWDLKAGETWHFQFPTGNVMFYDPNLTPSPANPQGGYVEAPGPIKYDSTIPANFGFWDAARLTWDAFGPTSTGGPPGSPGPDATPGTADDQYALEPWGAIRLVDPPLQSAFVQGFDIAADPAEEIAAGEVTSDVQFLFRLGNSFQAYPAARVSAFPGRLRKS